MGNKHLRWAETPYAGEKEPPTDPVTPSAGMWPTFFIQKNKEGNYLDPNGHKIELPITSPNQIDFDKELITVQRTLENLTPDQKKIGIYYGTGVPTKQWTPVIDRLVDTYGVSPTYAARILAVVQAAINDTMIIVWDLKYRWDVARPDQYDQTLKTLLCTPRFPAYPSGHATMSGCTQVVLSYFFPREATKLKKIAEDNALSRLYAGVHFPADNEEGLRLGRHIGSIIIHHLETQSRNGSPPIDRPFRDFNNAKIFPDQYQQFIPFPFPNTCTSLLMGMEEIDTGNVRTKKGCFSINLLSSNDNDMDRLPIVLQNKKGEYLLATGAIGQKDCFQTVFFCIEKIDEGNGCVSLSLLRPNREFAFEKCKVDPTSIVDELIHTRYCITVDLDCFCAIQCLDPQLVNSNRGRA
ncbi:CotY/CotZ family spore coat protein [Alteribacillus sp. HJP-4]|uniref:CotY/CotZ family spore coat protein n=1 Tax=Alteribacillus sp. HJP-4 TaxID=2775394 RepID=UPI0035CD1791